MVTSCPKTFELSFQQISLKKSVLTSVLKTGIPIWGEANNRLVWLFNNLPGLFLSNFLQPSVILFVCQTFDIITASLTLLQHLM